jgi:transposase
MSTSLLYHGFGIHGYHYVRTFFENGTIVFRIEQNDFTFRCPECGSRYVKRRGTVVRRFRTIPIGWIPVFIELAIQRVECLNCDAVRQVKLSLAERRRSYTRAFARYVLGLCRHMTIQDVAKHLKVGWDTVKDILKQHLAQRFKRPKLSHLKRIAIDEICIGKGHRYLTVVLDLKSGAVVFVGDGKGSDALVPFWKRLKRSKAKIKAVAIDMSPAYIGAVMDNLPRVAIVFDRFHVMKLFNDRLSDLRRQLQREAEGPLQRKVLKGTRWLLLKNPENLNGEKNEGERLQQALQFNAPLAAAYYLKEDLRQFWNQKDKASAEKYLMDWIEKAQSSKVGILMKMAKTMAFHKFGLLSYYDHPISTGPLEGTNNKIKTLQRQAYGFRDKEFFKLRIFGLHEAKYALIG